MSISEKNDWRNSNERFSQKGMLAEALIHRGIPLYTDFYQFCDYAISQGIGDYAVTMEKSERETFIHSEYMKYMHHRVLLNE